MVQVVGCIHINHRSIMGFSSKLTDEEDLLKKKYIILKRKKKILHQLRQRKIQEDKEAAETRANKVALKKKKSLIKATEQNPTNKRPYSKGYSANLRDLKSLNAAANTEAAKKLIKSGSIQLKIENKKVFKRSSKLLKRIKDSEGSMKTKSEELYQPFNAETKTETSDASSDKDENLNAKISSTDTKPRANKFMSRNDKGRNFKMELKEHKKGNTIFVHGYGITEAALQDLFSTFGKIININVESERSGFVTFSNLESADEAILKMNNEKFGDTRLKVSLARRQPMIESAVSGGGVWSGLAARRGEKGSNPNKERREMQSYDDDPF